MNKFGPCNDTFCSEKGPKEGHFGLKTAKQIEKRRLKGKEIRGCKTKITQCKLPVVSSGLRRFSGTEQLGSVQ